jgi:hypothetical protein
MKVPAELIPLFKWVAYKNVALPQNSPSFHTIIIVYRASSKIKYLYVTSQVEKAEMRCRNDKSALVKIQKSEWAEALTKDVSCIQCGKKYLNCVDIDEFKELYEENEANGMNYIGEIPENIKQKIKNAVNASKTYNAKEKSELTCGNDKAYLSYQSQ